MNFTCSGGSSSVLSSALNAAFDSMCTSSLMYTLNRDRAGRYAEFSRPSGTPSTPVFEAASLSIPSMYPPGALPLHESLAPQGLVAGASDLSQLCAVARIRAVEVLPVPRVPVNRHACATRPDSM